jgi:membrane protein required for colicin V production
MDAAGIHLGAYDIIALGIILFFMVLGLIKGFTFQVVRLITLLVALAVAKGYAGSTAAGDESGFAPHLMNWFPNQLEGQKELAVYVAFFIIFVGIFILGTLLAFLLRSLLNRLELRAYDKVLGGLLGILVGAVCVVTLVSLLALFSSQQEDSNYIEKLNNSYALKLSTRTIIMAKPFFPEALRQTLNDILERLPQEPQSEPGEEDGK